MFLAQVLGTVVTPVQIPFLEGKTLPAIAVLEARASGG